MVVSASAWLIDCGSGSSTAPNVSGPTGIVRGVVTDMQGTPQAVGRIFLLEQSGLSQDNYVDVDSTGAFDFGPVPVGNYQLHYWGDNLAGVPEPLPNPVPITVSVNQPTVVHFQIQLGAVGDADKDIFAGEFFFQEQPYGEPNGTVIVPLGMEVCWYNVGKMTHTVTGGPWGDSGPIPPLGNFMWTSNQLGTFPYRCSYYAPQMQAVLQVVPA